MYLFHKYIIDYTNLPTNCQKKKRKKYIYNRALNRTIIICINFAKHIVDFLDMCTFVIKFINLQCKYTIDKSFL